MRDVRDGEPGRRFQEIHEHSRRANAKGGRTLGRLMRVSLALVAFTIGAVLVVIPGPAIPFFFVTAALLATESRWVARRMDWLEVRLRVLFEWGEKRWHRLPVPARIAILVVLACCSIAAGVLTYRLLRG